MRDKETGGSAFPALAHHTDRWPTGGMTLRDYFAVKALQSSLACQSAAEGIWNDYTKLARDCYNLADAMLEARTK
jgi:hypothetical protein